MTVDLVIRADTAVAIRGDRIAAASPGPYGLDGLITVGTRVVDGAAVLPAFDDTHTHLIYAGQGVS